jgi:hypothetical protein
VANNNLEKQDLNLRLLLCAGLLLTQVCSYLGVEAMLYGVAILAGSVYVFKRPAESIWVTFFLLAITSLLYPVVMDETGVPEAGVFRPYNIVFASMAAAMVLAIRGRPRRARTTRDAGTRGLAKWLLALATVFWIATQFGELSPAQAGIIYVLQECSGWVSFFVFLWLGYKLSLSAGEVQHAFARLDWCALAYCLVFLAKFAYILSRVGLTAATEFAYAERVVLFFAGIVAVLAITNRWAPGAASITKINWPLVLIIVSAVVLSGSRGVAGAVFLTSLVLAMKWRFKLFLRLALVTVALVVAVAALALRSHSEVITEYVVAKFLISPDQDASLLGRLSEMEATYEAVRRNPLLGKGVLASYSFYDPLFGWRETTFVDNGFGYLLMKTGLLGTVIFFFVVLSWFKLLRRPRGSPHADALVPLTVLLYYVAFLPFGAAFFEIQYSWLIAIMCGYALSLVRVHGVALDEAHRTTKTAALPGFLSPRSA